MIPKIIHYCWFGRNPIPNQLAIYMESWKRFCPEYEIKLWNEDSFDIESHSFVKSAYKQKKYAYVSDYVRAYALYNYGGIYLDTDVELKNKLDEFLLHDAFTGFEAENLPFTAVWGSKPYHRLAELILLDYKNKTYTPNEPPNTISVTNLLVDHFNIDKSKNELQIGLNQTDKIHIYPSTTFCLDLPQNIATHHFYGSWLPTEHREYKEYAHYLYKQEQLKNNTNFNDKNILKIIAKQITFRNLLRIIRYKIKY